MDTNPSATTESDFNSTILDGGKLSSSHTENTLSLIDLENNNNNNDKKNNKYNNNFNNNNKNTMNNTYNHENYRNQQPIKSIKLTQGSDQINTTLLFLTRVITPLPRLQRQNTVLFNTEPVFLNAST